MARDFAAGAYSFSVVSGDETDEQEPRAGRLSNHLSLGVIARVYPRDVVDEVIIETRSKENGTGCCRPGWWSIT